MAKAKKITQDELKKFFEKTKGTLQKLKKETGVWMKKGEAELSRLSKIGKLEIDVVNLNMKREKLFKDIGKRVAEFSLKEEINNSAISDMCDKVNAVAEEAKEKRAAISKIGKGLFKDSSAKTRKRK